MPPAYGFLLSFLRNHGSSKFCLMFSLSLLILCSLGTLVDNLSSSLLSLAIQLVLSISSFHLALLYYSAKAANGHGFHTQ